MLTYKAMLMSIAWCSYIVDFSHILIFSHENTHPKKIGITYPCNEEFKLIQMKLILLEVRLMRSLKKRGSRKL